MNSSYFAPQNPTGMMISRPQRVSPSGKATNLFKVQITHGTDEAGAPKKYEVWATDEAIKNHFVGMEGNPSNHEIKSFAKHVYEERLRNTNGNPEEKAVFLSTNQKIHGNPKLWPNTLADTEIKW